MVDISILIWLVDKTNVELRGTALQGPFEQLVDFAISGNYALVQCHGKPMVRIKIYKKQQGTFEHTKNHCPLGQKC